MTQRETIQQNLESHIETLERMGQKPAGKIMYKVTGTIYTRSGQGESLVEAKQRLYAALAQVEQLVNYDGSIRLHLNISETLS